MKEEFDLEQLLTFDNLIYHMHKFIDSSQTRTIESEDETKIYYLFSKNYRDELSTFLQKNYDFLESKCTTIKSLVCSDEFYLLLQKVSSNLNVFEEISFDNKNYVRELIEVIKKEKIVQPVQEPTEIES